MEDFSKYSNDELIKMNQNLSENFEKIKREILILHEMLISIKNDSDSILKVLKDRG